MFDNNPLDITTYTEGLEAYRIDEYDLQIALEGLGKMLAKPIRFLLKLLRVITDGIKKVTDRIFHRKDPKKDSNSPFYISGDVKLVPRKNIDKEVNIEDILKSEEAKAEGKPDPVKKEEEKEAKQEDVKTKEEVKEEPAPKPKEEEPKSTLKGPEITFGNRDAQEELKKAREAEKKAEEEAKKKEHEELMQFQMEIKNLSKAERAIREKEFREERLKKQQESKELEKWKKRTNPDQRIGLFISKSKKYEATDEDEKGLKAKIKEIPKTINRNRVVNDYKKFIESLKLKECATVLCAHYEQLQSEMMEMLRRIGTYDKVENYKNSNVYYQSFNRVSSQVGSKSMQDWIKDYSWRGKVGRKLKVNAAKNTVSKYIHSYPEILTHELTHQVIAQQVDNIFYKIQTIVNSIQHHIDKFDDTYDRVLASNNYDASVQIDTTGSTVADLQQSLKRYGDALRTRAAALNANMTSFTNFVTNLGY